MMAAVRTTTPAMTALGIRRAKRSSQNGERLQRRHGPILTSIRTRVVAWFVTLLALATVGSVLVARQILLNRLDQRIDQELVQETQELRVLADGRDPETGAPFGPAVERIFRVFLERNIPSENEAMITFVGGEAYLRSRQVVPYRLDRDPKLVARWAKLEQTERGSITTRAGRVEFLAVPLNNAGEAKGVFLIAIFRDREMAGTNSAIAGIAASGGAVLLIGSILAWLVAERILGPVKNISQTARSISVTDLTRRIEVSGRDELSMLASTFNEMLDRLEETFRSEKQFFDDVGHELRTPITIIRGHLETVGPDRHDFQRVKALVMDELGRMARFVEDLLLLARSELPDFLELEMVDVQTLTADLYAKAAALAPRSWSLEEVGQGWLEADRQRITQALLELARNATKHTSSDDAVSLGSRVSNEEVRFWVSDTGPGVAPKDRERIFQRSQMGSNAKLRKGGAGFGLTIVSAIAKAHHGKVELESEPGMGATFSLVLPMDQPVAASRGSDG